MADKTIGELPGVTSLDSGSLFVAQQQGAASKVTGAQLIQFANVETAAQVSAAQAAAQEAAASETAAETAKNGAETAQTAIENMTVEAETLAAGAQATVQKIVTSGQPIKLLFGLPTGPTGPAGGVDSFNGRTGAVIPQTGDYTAEMVGAALAPLSSSVTLYVNSSTGDDSNSGTQSQPFKTIQAAIDSLPKNLDKFYAIINVAVGSYPEDVIITGFTGCGTGSLQLNTTESVEINSLFISGNSSAVQVNGITVTGSKFGIAITVRATNVYLTNVSANGGGVTQRGILAGNETFGSVTMNNCNISGFTIAGISADCGSIVVVRSGNVSNCGVGISAGNAGSGLPGIVFAGSIKPTFSGNTTDTAKYYNSQMWGFD